MLVVEIVPAAVAAEVFIGVACGRVLRRCHPVDAARPAERAGDPRPPRHGREDSEDATRITA